MIPVFDHPRWLSLALAIPPAYAFFRYRLARLGSGVSRLAGTDPKALFAPMRLRAAWFAASWLFLVLALAGPRIGTRLVPVREEGASVMITIDISRSMTVSDVLPDRLTYAARYASLLSARLGPVACGVTLAKGTGALSVPMTLDRQAVSDLLDSLSPALLTSPGTSLAAGVRAALAAFPPSDASSRTILLFTDGDETSGSLVDAAREAGRAGVTLLIIGIGTAQGASIDADPDPDPGRVDLRTTVLREDLLLAAAEAAGGKSAYVNAADSGSALRVLDYLGSSATRGPELRYSEEPVSRYPECVFFSIAFLGVGLVTGGVAWRKKEAS